MSRDFDARVRDLHEAPIDFSSVKGKARKIRRNRRAAVAGSVLGVAAVVTPIAVLAGGGGNDKAEPPPFVDKTSQAPTAAPDPTGADYLEGRTWHQADGDEVQLPKGDYSQVGIWDGNLVTLQSPVEVYPAMTIFDADGNQVGESQPVAGFAISSDQSILAYTNVDGQLVAQWDGGQTILAEDVTDSAGGESVGGAPASVIGTAPCEPESGSCLVRINTALDGCRGIGSSDVPLPSDGVKCFDEQDGVLSYTDKLKDFSIACSGLWSAETLDFLWHTCDFQTGDISPDGQYVVGMPSQYDGLGTSTISILDARTGEQTAIFSPEGGFIDSAVAWTGDNQLLLSVYDGANWHLFSMSPDGGSTTEIADPVRGDEVLRPFRPIRH